ncbi:lysine-specific demethylase 8 [Moesziomyces aphidis]|uniref:Lysine-specific demethylase 8 n=1 Tax=Moesziomyces aphidis TaxID=84754 RepID=W3VKE4_MOEAP|nr:lysine-specific demethylase 8 [Moesziomyces aphidis]
MGSASPPLFWTDLCLGSFAAVSRIFLSGTVRSHLATTISLASGASRIMWVRRLLSIRDGLPTSRFVHEFFLPKRPARFETLLSSTPSKDKVVWPALHRWSSLDANGQETLDGLKRPDTAHIIVPVEISRPNVGYNAAPGHWDRIEMPLDAFVQGKIPWSNDGKAAQHQPVGYLAQFDLLSKAPSLAAEAPALPHTAAGPKGTNEQWRSNTWIGPPATYTPLHRDPYENIFAQVVGRKRIHLFAPHLAPYLYINQTGPQRNTSTIASEHDLLHPAHDRPLLSTALASEDAFVTELGPGDVLYIPKGWYHFSVAGGIHVHAEQPEGPAMPGDGHTTCLDPIDDRFKTLKQNKCSCCQEAKAKCVPISDDNWRKMRDSYTTHLDADNLPRSHPEYQLAVSQGSLGRFRNADKDKSFCLPQFRRYMAELMRTRPLELGYLWTAPVRGLSPDHQVDPAHQFDPEDLRTMAWPLILPGRMEVVSMTINKRRR